MADWQLAQRFKTTLPAVNHIRRKFKLSRTLLEQQKKPVNKAGVLKLCQHDKKRFATWHLAEIFTGLTSGSARSLYRFC